VGATDSRRSGAPQFRESSGGSVPPFTRHERSGCGVLDHLRDIEVGLANLKVDDSSAVALDGRGAVHNVAGIRHSIATSSDKKSHGRSPAAKPSQPTPT
jgi:hypothetical protein